LDKISFGLFSPIVVNSEVLFTNLPIGNDRKRLTTWLTRTTWEILRAITSIK